MLEIEPYKILFIIGSLSGGGAERSMFTLMKNMDMNKFTPSLVVFNESIAYEQEIPDGLQITYLKKISRIDNFRLINSLSKIIQKEQPSIIYSLLNYANIITVISNWKAGSNIPVVISQRTYINEELQEEHRSSLKRWLKKLIIQYTYSQADWIHCISDGLRTNLVHDFNISRDKIKVIFNAHNIKEIVLLAGEEVEHPWFQEDIPVLVACGRLSLEKNYPLLLRSLRLVLETTMVRLIILGGGKERQSLEEYANKLGINNCIQFLGFQENPFKYMSRSTALVLSSSWEGLGRVIIEAMTCGVPVISTRCPFGPEEIITHGLNGLLVPVQDEHKLAEAILEILGNEGLRKKLAKAGQRRAEDFDVGKILPQFEEMLIDLCESSIK